MKRLVLILAPLVVFGALVVIFAISMNRDPNLVRSVMINRPAPDFTMAAVEGTGVPGFGTTDLTEGVTVVNVFASWCVPCEQEHPFLSALKVQSGVRLFGINQRDQADNAAKFLARLGNPYDRIGADPNNRVSIDWGVYGVPETFVVNARGIITYRHVGPITAETLESDVLPAIEAAKKAS